MPRLSVEELRSGRGDPLFVFTGAGGETDEVQRVVDALAGDTRVVAVAVGATPGADTIRTLATAGVGAIRDEQPRGPYRLLGYSFGGLLALEAARVLVEAGEPVSFVGLVDALFDQRHWPAGLFVRATARRTAVHTRALAGQPPGLALRELAGRAVRLARRLRDRRRAAGTGPSSSDTVQEANLAVLADWQPQVLDHPVALFAATESDFGCDLADLWHPWLPQLEVHRVWGNHLDLTQSGDGAARLAAAVTRALDSPPPRLRVLVASTFRWPGAARLAVDLHAVGCTVEAVAPRGSALHVVAAVSRSHRLGRLAPLRSLRRALEVSEADLVVPFDDRTRHALALLHERSDPRTDAGARLRRVLESSLGSPDRLAWAHARATVLAAAREAGVLTPETEGLHSVDDVSTWFARHPGRAVVKTDGSWGGRGVAVVADAAEGRAAFLDLRRRPPLVRALKRLVVDADPWPARALLSRSRPTLSIQSHVHGRLANAAVACHRGTALGSVQAEVVESDGPTGPSTVLRVVDHPDIGYAVKSVVSHLELSGLCGLDFVIDDHDRAHLLELNPRATPTSHLVAADGTDLLTALRVELGQARPGARTTSYPDGLVALFPQELQRDAASAHLRLAHHDVPAHAPDLVAHVLAGARRPRRGGATAIPAGPA